MSFQKILILQSNLSSYNAPIYRRLAEKVDLTVAYTVRDEGPSNPSYKVAKLDYFNFLV